MRLRKGRKQAGMVLGVLVAALLVGGAPVVAADREARSGALDWAFAWVRSLWEAVDEGPHIDPDGLTVTGPEVKPRDGSDVGWHIDPNGLTVTGPEVKPSDGSDVGWHIDPDG